MATGDTSACCPWPRGVAEGVVHPPHPIMIRMALIPILRVVIILVIPPILLLILIRLIIVLVFPLKKHGQLSLPSSEV